MDAAVRAATELSMDRPSRTELPGVGRRRLLRGAIAAPALMTVCSGSALANASSLRCLTNAQTIPLPPNVPVGSTTTDGYVRVRLWTVSNTCDGTRAPGQGTATAPGLALGADRRGAGAGAPGGASPTPTAGGAPSLDNLCVPQATYFVRGEDLSAYKLSLGMPSSTQWQVITFPGYVTSGGPIAPLGPTGFTPPAPSDYWVIVRFNSSGHIVGFGADQLGAALGASCLNSAAPFIQQL